MMRLRLPVCLVFLVAVMAAAPVAAAELQRLHGLTMGTTWSVLVDRSPTHARDVLQRGIQTELDRVDGQMSTYKPDSDLSRFNRAPAGRWQQLPPEFFTVLRHALQLAKDSDGAYDPTVGPLVNLWGFGPDQRPRQPPTAQAIAAAQARVGWWKLQLDPATRRVRQPGGVYLDLSAVAKGYGVDQVATTAASRSAVSTQPPAAAAAGPQTAKTPAKPDDK